MIPIGSGGVDPERSATSVHAHSSRIVQHAARGMQRISCRDRSTDLVAFYGEVGGSYMDGMLPLMIGGKDDTNRKWGGGPREEWHLRARS